jgi:hypothetical protein
MALLSSSWVFAEPPPENFGGIGARGGLRDPTSGAVAGKVRLADFGKQTLSLRPAVLLGSETELRLPVAIDFAGSARYHPFAGLGAAYNTDGLGDLDPMVSGGVDVSLSSRLILSFTCNYIFQTRISDQDKELIGTINLVF